MDEAADTPAPAGDGPVGRIVGALKSRRRTTLIGAAALAVLLLVVGLSIALAAPDDDRVSVASGDGADAASSGDSVTPTTHDHQKMLRDQAALKHHNHARRAAIAAAHAHGAESGAAHTDHDATDEAHGHTTGGSSATSSHAHAVTTGGAAAASPHDHGATGSTGDTGSTAPHDHGSTGSTGGTGGSGSTGGSHDHGGGGSGGTTPTTHPHHDDGSPVDDWATTRRNTLLGNLDAATKNARLTAMDNYLIGQLRNRSTASESTIKQFVWWQRLHALDEEHGGNHTHGPQQWIETDAATTATVNAQLTQSKKVVARYPNAAAAMADGYFQVTPWMYGIGAHYLNTNYINTFNPARPSILLFNGNSPSSVLVGVSYAILNGGAAPEGFAGPNDTWHLHPQLCTVGIFVVGADNTPPSLCSSVGGRKGNGFGNGNLWMMHLWQVPGWESNWGLMSGESPALNLRRWDGT